MNHSLHPGASQDLDDAAAYYQKQAGNVLSQAFLAEFERSAGRLLRHPLLGSKWRKENAGFSWHASLTRSFTLVSQNELHIFAVSHQSRHPAYWRGRK